MERFEEHLLNYKHISEQIYNEPFPDVKATIREVKQSLDKIKPFIKDSVEVIAGFVDKEANVLFEGAQGTFLDVDHGSYPFVTSSSTSIGGAFTGGGVFVEFDKRIGIVKAYTTRVGEGPFPTELFDDTGKQLQKNGNEFGATTGRPRRCGWLDLKMLKRSFVINGFNYVSLSKISCLSGFETVKAAVDYDAEGKPVYKEFSGWSEEVEGATSLEQLPKNCKNYINFIEDYLGVPIGMISTGPHRKDIIFKDDLF